MLPEQFIAQLTLSLGPERAGEVLYFIQNTAPSVAVRLNPFKMPSADMSADQAVCDALSWLPVDRARRTFSQWGSFLETRPEFYLDPLFHAGTYYVQEASSMYLERIFPIMRQMREDRPSGAFAVLDLCAAPGGKTTHLLSMLRGIPGAFLVSNEIIRSRASVLCENVSKWGAANVIVTNNDPADFAALQAYFDVVVVDAPCSGEGMFRKDRGAVEEWSEANVRLCADRQKRILSDVLPTLRPGGLLVYSTCTFNHFEDEDIVAWLESEYGFEVLEQRHFYPGDEGAGEGFFFSLLRMPDRCAGDHVHQRDVFPAGLRGSRCGNGRRAGGSEIYRPFEAVDWIRDGFRVFRKGNIVKAFPDGVCAEMQMFESCSGLRIMMSGTAVAEVKDGSKGRLLVLPQYSLIQSDVYHRGSLPEIDVPLDTALAYLRRDPIVLPEAPSGYVVLTYSPGLSALPSEGTASESGKCIVPVLPFGLVKNLGNRCNSLLPHSVALRKR
ncbi:MAG TPA: hypothetical protein IAB96_03815 [Candidatus Coprenecus pullicola]|nr:hypothetical protein [Candidatus Coprenecus pullicola]